MGDDILEQVLRNQLAMMNALLALGVDDGDLRDSMDATLRLLERIRQERVHAHK